MLEDDVSWSVGPLNMISAVLRVRVRCGRQTCPGPLPAKLYPVRHHQRAFVHEGSISGVTALNPRRGTEIIHCLAAVHGIWYGLSDRVGDVEDEDFYE